MELSSEDSLKLNVLMANAKAVRINEQELCVLGWTEQGEVRVRLNPTGRAERYLRAVRELLSATVLGSPGGYPVYLKRWTRMGPIANTRLADLLMLGEAEAVVAVTRSPMLTDEIARLAWWAMPDAANARSMLHSPTVAQGAMGPVLAAFLVEFLPFEADPAHIIESVRLVLQPGLIEPDARQNLWERGRKKSVFMAGFLLAVPDDLPDLVPAAAVPAPALAAVQAAAAAGNRWAAQLLRLWSAAGQSFLAAARNVLLKPSNQDVVVAGLLALERYATDLTGSLSPHDIEACYRQAGDGLAALPQQQEALAPGLAAVAAVDPAAARSVLELALVREQMITPIFAQTDAVGSLMRRKIEPVVQPIVRAIDRLLQTKSPAGGGAL